MGLDRGLGLSLYLDAEVEFVALTEADWHTRRRPYLTTQLLVELEHPERRLFLVNPESMGSFTAVVGEKELVPRRMGSVDRVEVVDLVPRTSP